MKHARPDRRLLMTKNLIMMLVMVVVAAVAVWSWFSNFKSAESTGMSITAKSMDNVELALPEKVEVNGEKVDSFPLSNDSWKYEINFKESGYFKDLVKDITSDGKQFVVPNFEAASGLEEGRKVITDDVWVEGLSSKEALTNGHTTDDDQYNYISLDFYIRSTAKSISILGDSFLAAGSEVGYDGNTTNSSNKKPLKGSSIYRASSYGAAEGTANAFSSDALVGAMRVSLIGAPVDSVATNSNTGVTTESAYNGGDWASQSALKFLWLPRPDLYLKTADDSDDWRLFTGIKPSGNSAQNGLSASEVDNLAKKTYAHSFYNGNTVTGGVKKGLTAGKYMDSTVKDDISGATTSNVFMVSDTRTDNQLGNTGHYPVLGQSKVIANNALESSKSINFTTSTIQGDTRPTSGYYVYKFTLNIWAEGEDAEARRSMNTGAFNMELYF